MERVSWFQNGSKFTRVQGNVTNVDKIPVGIYNVNFNPMEGWSLELVAEKFAFPYKVYGLQTHFVKHVLTTFRATKGNLGILLNGVKGTGKTVTAKVLANELNLPIINVKSFGDNNTALVEYLSSFNFDCVFFLDEFEKNWSDQDSSILQIMDGVYTSDHRRIFLLTTNETHINENLLSRPSRLRYVKEFGNLEKDVVIEYLKDNLKNGECLDCVVDFVDTLQISTIDILKTIVEDVNIHGFDTFLENKDIFNVKTANYSYNVHVFRFYKDPEEKPYSIEDFVKDIKLTETVHRPYEWQYSDEEAYHKAMVEYSQKRCKRPISQTSFSVNKSIHSYKVGDHFGSYDSEVIDVIDLKNNVIITHDEDGESVMYHIKNPDAKPSLYSSSNYAYGYGGIM